MAVLPHVCIVSTA